MKTLGQVGYEAYAESTGGLTWDLRPMPKWEEITEKIRKAWNAAALAIVIEEGTRASVRNDKPKGDWVEPFC